MHAGIPACSYVLFTSHAICNMYVITKFHWGRSIYIFGAMMKESLELDILSMPNKQCPPELR